jgi:hypothetical protein
MIRDSDSRSAIENNPQASLFVGRHRASISNGGSRPRREECESRVPSRNPLVDRRLVMSSPVPDDADKRLMQALPWVSDPHRQDETRRLQEQVVEAAQRLERESSGFALQTPARPSQSQTSVGFRLAVAHPSDEKGSGEEFGRLWAPLRPELMPPPPRNEMGLPGLGLLAGLLGAVGMAAAVALIVTNVVRIPTINAAISEDRAAKSKSVSSIVMAELAQIQAAQANVQPAEPPAAPTRPMLATATQTNALAVERPLVAAPATSVRVAPDLKVAPEQPAVQPPPAAVLPELRPAVSLSSGEVASMLKRGRDLLAAGDIASGRLMLTHVAEAGDAEASFLLAGTYDAAVLAKLRVVGVQPDPAKARAWYAKAAEQGSLEARQRLQALR